MESRVGNAIASSHVGRKSVKVKNEYTLKFGDPQPDSVTAAVKGIPALSLA